MKKNILIISIYYPPIASIASNRIESFAKYLDKDKYNVFVHTLFAEHEYQLSQVEVHRAKNDVFFKPLLFTKRTNKLVHYVKVIYNKLLNYFFENEYRAWIDESLKTLPDFIQKHNIDVVISTFAPTAPHLVGLELKKKNSSLKWIADMRDEMSQGLGLRDAMRKQYKELENEVFENADALTSVSRPILDGFASMCLNDKIIFKEIRNGYDFKLKESFCNNEQFTISYTGSFYGDINPDNFLKALNSIVLKDSSKKIKVRFVGVKTHFTIPQPLVKMIEVEGSVTHENAINIMQQSDALLLIHPNNGRKGVFTGKLFEYLAALTPIIALVDEEDVAAKLIKDANAGYVTDNAKIEKIEEILLQAYNEWEKKIPRKFNLDIIKKHHRKEQTKRLENLIEELYNEK